MAPVLLQDTPGTAKRSLLASADSVARAPEGREAGRREGPGLGYLLLKLIGQEQELASGEAPDIELAEVLEFTVDLLLADPRPPPDGEDQHRRADTGVIGARKILGKQNRERFMQLKTLENLERALPGAGAETREGREEPVYVGLDRKT